MRFLKRTLAVSRGIAFWSTVGGLLVATVPPPYAMALAAVTADGQIPAKEQARLVQLILAATDYANKTGDETAFRQLSAMTFRIANMDADIEAGFDVLRHNGIDPAPFVRPVQWKSIAAIENGKVRLFGVLPTSPVQTEFDMSWQLENGNYRLAAIAITLSPV